MLVSVGSSLLQDSADDAVAGDDHANVITSAFRLGIFDYRSSFTKIDLKISRSRVVLLM